MDWVINEIIGICNKSKLFAHVRAGHYGFCTLNLEDTNLVIFMTEQFSESSYIMLFLWFQYETHFQRLRWFIDPPILKTLYSVPYHIPNSPACMIHWTFNCTIHLSEGSLQNNSLRDLSWSYFLIVHEKNQWLWYSIPLRNGQLGSSNLMLLVLLMR